MTRIHDVEVRRALCQGVAHGLSQRELSCLRDIERQHAESGLCRVEDGRILADCPGPLPDD